MAAPLAALSPRALASKVPVVQVGFVLAALGTIALVLYVSWRLAGGWAALHELDGASLLHAARIGLWGLAIAGAAVLAYFSLRLLVRRVARIRADLRRVAMLEQGVGTSEACNLQAQELLDSMAQSLAFLLMRTRVLQNAVRTGDAALAARTAAEIGDGVQECYGDVRHMLERLRVGVAPCDLHDALAALLAAFERRTAIATSLEIVGADAPLSPDRRLDVLHVVREALANARRHAYCTQVEVTVERGPEYRVIVRDDGRGFDPAAAARAAERPGLRIMRERAERAGGRIEVHSQPGAGTEVRLAVPAGGAPAA